MERTEAYVPASHLQYYYQFNQSQSGDWNITKHPRPMQNQPNRKHCHPLAAKMYNATEETKANLEQTKVVATTRHLA
jgi:hypothetical protein